MADLALEPQEFRLLDRLRLNPGRSFAGRIRGERLTAKRGLSIEFADYREYAEGDDLRHLDWNVLARLDHPIMKSYRDEEDLAVHLLVDASASMSFGEPTKLQQAARLACALGYAGLMGGDAVYPKTLGLVEAPLPALRGRANYHRLDAWSRSISAKPGAGLAAAIRTFAASPARRGLCMVLTDGMDPDAKAALRLLASRGHEVQLVQILSVVEIDPDLEGDLRLIDAETQDSVEITASRPTLQEYKRRLDAHNESLKEEVRRGGGRWCLVRSDESLESVLRRVWLRDGWLTS